MDNQKEEEVKLLVERIFPALRIQLFAIRGNTKYLILRADSCGERLEEKFDIIETETIKQTLDRAISVCSITFVQLATMEYIQNKEMYGNAFIN